MHKINNILIANPVSRLQISNSRLEDPDLARSQQAIDGKLMSYVFEEQIPSGGDKRKYNYILSFSSDLRLFLK